MANVSSSNGLEKRPKLRFPGFDEPYILHRIGDIYAERSERGAADMELLSVTMNGGVMQRSEIEGKDNSSEDKSNYKVVRKGDMVYNSMRMWQGANGVSSYNGIVSPAYTVLTAKVSICNEYFAALFKNYKLINEFRKNSQGMTSDTWNLKYPQIETIKVYLPEVAEQEKVASMLVIAAQATLVEQLKKYKRGLSDTLFTHIVQRSDCQIMKLGEVFELLQNNTFSREELTDIPSSVQNIHYGDVLIKYGAVVNITEDKPPYIKPDIELKKFSSTSYLCDGDIVFADTAEDYTVGKATEIAGANGLSVLSGLHTIPCRPLIKFHPMYLGYYFNSSLFRTQIYPLVQGTKVSSISKGALIKTSVYEPTLEVQKRVAFLLYSMDCRIAMEERKSAALTTARAAPFYIKSCCNREPRILIRLSNSFSQYSTRRLIASSTLTMRSCVSGSGYDISILEISLACT